MEPPGRAASASRASFCSGVYLRRFPGAVGLISDRVFDIEGPFADQFGRNRGYTKFIEHRVGDQRVVRLIQKWLAAGLLEDGKRTRSAVGTVQRGSISPLLANIYLHYVFDLWIQQWRTKQARGDIIVVRYSDDFVVGFQHETEAKRFVASLRERLAKFGLALHADKTRLIEFGRFADRDRRSRGEGKPETFDFLGFTHICTKTKSGTFTVLRQTMSKRLRGKLEAVKWELRRRRHRPVSETGAYLRSVVVGHYRYYRVPLNRQALGAFRNAIVVLWWRSLERRSQMGRVESGRMYRLAKHWLPRPTIYHPYPLVRLGVITRGRSRMR